MSRTVNSNPVQPDNIGAGAFTKSFHLEMILDRERVTQCMRAVEAHGGEEKVFVEVGCGTGLFSIEATKYYGTVIAIENDRKILDVAKVAADRAGLSRKIRFIEANGFDVSWRDIGVRADVAFVEMLSIWAIEEPQVLMCNHVLKHILHASGVIIPRRVSNLLECGNYDFGSFGIQLKAPIAQFVSRLAPRLNTISQLAHVIDFRQENEPRTAGAVEFVALTDELINCVRLSSIVDFGRGSNFYSSDTLMPLTLVPTVAEHPVRRNDCYVVTFEYFHGSPLGESSFVIGG